MTDFSYTKDENVIDEPQDNLNQKFFNGMKLKRNVRKAMLQMLDFLIEKIPLNKFNQFILEKNFVGSMTSFQWSENADIDLHLIVDINSLAQEYNAEPLEIIESLRIVADKYDKKLYLLGYPVEFYIQSEDEPFYSVGVYDIEYDTWTKVPDIKQFDKEKVKEAKQLAKEYKSYISSKLKTIEKRYKRYEKNSEDIEIIKKLKNDYIFIKNEFNKLKEIRNKGIRLEGDSSIENMKFKFLQRSDTLTTMKNCKELLKSIYFEPVEEYNNDYKNKNY